MNFKNKKPLYYDIHGHLNFNAYKNDRDEVIKRTLENSVWANSVGTKFETSKLAVELAEENEGLFAIIGLHPIHTSESFHDDEEIGEEGAGFKSKGEVFDREKYLPLAKHEKTLAIGECGLDYFHLDPSTPSTSSGQEGSGQGKNVELQRKAFTDQIHLANEVGKPLMLHLRSGSGRSAYKDAYEILKKEAKVIGDLHFFAGSVEEAKLFLDLGFYFSFTGAITFAKNYEEIIRFLPLNRIMAETDCPYVSPVPNRGKRNEPSGVIEVVKKIAEIKGLDVLEVREQILENSIEFFRIQNF